jgi:hypothetical protein
MLLVLGMLLVVFALIAVAIELVEVLVVEGLKRPLVKKMDMARCFGISRAEVKELERKLGTRRKS